MTRPLWPHQERALAELSARFAAGARRVLVVCPTGGGKTEIGISAARQASRVVWVAPQRENVFQAAGRLREVFGRGVVGVVTEGEPRTLDAPIQVGTVQSLLGEGVPETKADLLVLDEAHHYLAPDWREVVTKFAAERTLGLTATPWRDDDEPLGDVFDQLVIAAQYSELLRARIIVPALVIRPDLDLGNDLAMDPLTAWIRYSNAEQTFGFTGRVKVAQELARDFRRIKLLDGPVRAECVEHGTGGRMREDVMARFRAGKVRVLWSVDCLGEGVDVPEASVAILARKFLFLGTYIQRVGRVLRSAPGKRRAIVIDLTGSTLRHGLPDQDRDYSLTERPTPRVQGQIEREWHGVAPTFDPHVRELPMSVVAHPGIDLAPPEPIDAVIAERTERRAKIDAKAEAIARRSGGDVGDAARNLLKGLVE